MPAGGLAARALLAQTRLQMLPAPGSTLCVSAGRSPAASTMLGRSSWKQVSLGWSSLQLLCTRSQYMVLHQLHKLLWPISQKLCGGQPQSGTSRLAIYQTLFGNHMIAAEHTAAPVDAARIHTMAHTIHLDNCGAAGIMS